MNKNIVNKYNRILNNIDVKSPLSIGNGDFALTLDITGSQSLYNLYKDIPLSTISNKFWFKKNNLKDIRLENIKGKFYMTSNLNQEEEFEELRRYPHKFNLFYILLFKDNELINKDYIETPHQELDLYNGILNSSFIYKGESIKTLAFINQENDELSYKLDGTLSLKLDFTYPFYNKEGYITSKKAILNKDNDLIHIIYNEENSFIIKIKSNTNYKIIGNMIEFDNVDNLEFNLTLDDFKDNTFMSTFWEEDTDVITNIDHIDERMILSKYLLKVNSCGTYPPSEAGLTFNNWYSKFHLEMHLIHSLWLIRCGHITTFMKSLDYYKSITEEASNRAKLNGYKGFRYPKMTSPDGLDSPSPIGTLLIWQAPHLLYALQEIYKYSNDVDLIKPYTLQIKGVTDFLISLLHFNDDKIELLEPHLECSESIPLDKCINSMFEIEYIRETLKNQEDLDLVLFGKIRYNYSEIVSKLVLPKISNGIYLRTHGIVDSFDIYPDHPSEVFSYSYFKSTVIDDSIMNNTINFCISKLDFNTFWGWDFPFMGLCLLKLGRIKEAIDITFYDTPNNEYLYNGHNTTPREDLKVYLPANGAYLLFYRELCQILKDMEDKHDER